MLSTSNLTIQFGSKILFEDVSVKFGGGNRYGLIGANGSGKSTFMKIISGQLEATGGSVSVDDNKRVGILKQDQFAYEEFSVLDTVIMGHPELFEIKQERDRIYGLAEMSDEDGMKIADLEMRFGELDGYTAESRAGELLLSVGIPTARHFGPMSEIAPGFKLRVLLIQALFSDPDILLLDEPTNNLDIDTIRWLEDVLVARDSTMIIISHDRHFLNTVCTHMADLDFGEVRLFPGNYDAYMTASTQARERLLSDNAKKKDKIKELQTFVSRFSANASKAKQATSRAKLIDKIQLDDVKPSSRVSPFIRFTPKKEIQRLVLSVEGVSKAFGETKLYDNVDFKIGAGERVAILGDNGVGKTTLLNCFMEQVEFEGKVKWSENASVGYFEQDHEHYFENKLTVYEWMEQWRRPNDDEQSIRGILGRMLFSKDAIGKKVSVLSGGEKARMLFGKMIMEEQNVLLLDEPTNHLDMESIEALNLALENYEGTIIFVSHDREFVSSIATRIIHVADHKATDYDGIYEDFLAKRLAAAK